MGTVLEMRHLALLAVLALVAACGNSNEADTARGSLDAIKGIGALVSGRKPAPPDVAQIRAALEAAGKPVVSVSWAERGYSNFMAPYYPPRGGVQTWASATIETVSLREGVLVQSRGFGPDLMAAQAPSLGQIASASGRFHRIHEYLDGGDRPVQMDFDCSFAPGGAEEVVILDRRYAANRVDETCSSGAVSFTNRYWFQSGGKLRQSAQILAPGLQPLVIQHIMD